MVPVGSDMPGEIPTILVLPGFPWPDTGAGQRSRLLLEAVAGLGPVHVVLLSDGMPSDALAQLPQAVSITLWEARSLKIRGLIRYVPIGAMRILQPDRFYRVDPVVRERLAQLVIETGARAVLFRYVPTFCATGVSRRADLAVLVDVDDRDDQKYATRLQRLFGDGPVVAALLKWPLSRLSRLLQDRLKDVSLLWFTGPEDTWHLAGVRTAIAPNVPALQPVTQDLPLPSAGDAVLFVGISTHVPNRDGVKWFLDHCWPDLSRQFPQMRLRIVGRGPLWQEMARHYPHLANVDFVGPVDDLAVEYARARLCICPVREGGGSKIKVIEAAAYGRPVVGMTHALRGFGPEILNHAPGADSPQEFIAACAGFLSEAEMADRCGQELMDWQKQHYSRLGAVQRMREDIRSVLPPA